MIEIGFHNAAQFLFQNQLVREAFPQYKHLFDSWAMSQRVSHLRSLGMRAIVDFMNSVTNEDVQKISNIFNMPVRINKPEISALRNIVGNIENFEFMLPQSTDVIDYAVYRKGDKVSVLINTGGM